MMAIGTSKRKNENKSLVQEEHVKGEDHKGDLAERKLRPQPEKDGEKGQQRCLVDTAVSRALKGSHSAIVGIQSLPCVSRAA